MSNVNFSNVVTKARINYNGVSSFVNTTANVVKDSAYKYLDSQTADRTEQDAFKYSGDKIYRAAAVAALVGGNFAEAQDTRSYNRIANDIQNNMATQAGGTDLLNAAGLGTQAQDNLKDVMEKTTFSMNATKDMSSLAAPIDASTFVPTQAPNISIGANSTQITFNVNNSSLSSSEIKSLTSSGSFERNGVKFSGYASNGGMQLTANVANAQSDAAFAMVAGSKDGYANVNISLNNLVNNSMSSITGNQQFSWGSGGQGCKISAAQASTIAQAQANARAEIATRNRLLNAGTTSQKQAALKEIQQRLSQANKTVNPNLENRGKGASNGTGRIKNHIGITASERTGANAARIANGAGSIKRAQAKAMQRRGGAIVRQQLLGSDFGGSVNTLVATGRVAKQGAKFAFTTSAKIANGTFALGTHLVDGALTAVGAGTAGVGNFVGNKRLANAGMKVRNANLQGVRNAQSRLRRRTREDLNAIKNGGLNNFMAKKGAERRAVKVKRADARAERLLARSKTTNSATRARRLDRRSQRLQRKARRIERRSLRIINFRNRLGQIGHVLTAPVRFVQMPFKLFSRFVNFIKKYILFPIGATMAIIFALPALMVMFLSAAHFIIHFFSDMPTTNLVGELNSVNYNQFIVDTATQGIASSFNNIAKEDALTFYLVNKPVESEGIPWYMAPEKGQIEHIWAWEEADNTSRYKNPEDETGETNWTGPLIYANSDNPLPDDSNYKTDVFSYKPEAEREDLLGVTQNLLPIMTLMHTRYYGDVGGDAGSIVRDDEEGQGLTFGNWTTGLAYVYYMYAISHDVSKYDNDPKNGGYSKDEELNTSPYSYDIKDPDTPAEVYESPIEYDSSSYVFNRPADYCTNLYVHDEKNAEGQTGVSEERGLLMKALRLLESAGKSEGYTWTTAKRVMLLKRMRSIRKEHLLDPVDVLQNYSGGFKSGITVHHEGEPIQISVKYDLQKGKQGLFVWDGTDETLPASTGWDGVERSSACDNFVSFKLAEEEEDGLKVQYMGKKDKFTITGMVTKFVPHTNNGATMPSESKFDVKAVWNGETPVDPRTNVPCHVHGTQSDCMYYEGKGFRTQDYVCGHSEGEVLKTYEVEKEIDGVTVIETVEEKHHHTNDCYGYESDIVYYGDHKTVCQHKHQDWNGLEDSGCWMTLNACAGHCGGHITPKVNLVQKMSWKGLIQDDSFRTIKFIAFEDIVGNEVGANGNVTMNNFTNILDLGNWLADKVDATPTIAEWRLYWKVKCASWYTPYGHSPLGWIETISREGIEHLAAVIDVTTGMLHNLFSWVTGTEDYVDWNYFNKRKELEGADLYDFDGWWSQADNAEPHEYNSQYLAELDAYFGGGWWTDKYEFAKEVWEMFDTRFCNGFIPELTQEEIDKYMAIAEANGLTENQRAILLDALQHVGKYYYSFTGPGHDNGRTNDSGMSECSGFVSGVLSRVLGYEVNNSAAGYYNLGTVGGTLTSGTIVAKIGKTSNHVMIYLGKSPNGGHYVVDCSSTAGGSAVREISDSYLAQYNSHYNVY